MSEKDGGPAFPADYYVIDKDGNGPILKPFQGMSLRDWFAGMALQGMFAANSPLPQPMSGEQVDEIFAREAYKTADAMLKSREASK